MRRRRGGTLRRVFDLLVEKTDLRPPPNVDAPPIAWRDWEAAVGSRIAARARPVKLVRGVLHVRAATATWAQELALLGDEILAQLRARRLPVESLRFHVGTVEPPSRPASRDDLRLSPPLSPIPEPVREQLGRVADAELRRAIERAASRNLGWQAMNAAARPVRSGRPGAPPPPPAATPAPGRPERLDAGEAPSAPPPRVLPPPAATEERTAARAPRAAASESAPQGRTTKRAREARRGRP